MGVAEDRRDRYRQIAERARGIPGAHGLRVNRVYLVGGTWSGTYTGELTETQSSTELTVGGGYPPKVRLVSDERLALGELPTGAIEVGPLTPEHSTGGIDFDDLGANVTAGNTLSLQIVGPAGTTYYDIVSVKSDRALRYVILAKPKA